MKLLIVTLTFSSILLANQLDEITVVSSKTNSKENESVQTINILDQEQLKIQNISKIDDLSSVLPNVNISGIGNRTDKTFTFRGISNYVTYESSVAMYLDDIPIPFSYGYGAFDSNNISRVEVLKGPQGTLYGKSAQSGVINLYTKPISNKDEKEIKIELGNYGKKEFYGRTSGKVNKKIKYSLSISKDKENGFSKNKTTNTNFDYKNLTAVNSKIKYNLNDNSNISLNYYFIDTDDGGAAFKVNTKEDPFNIYNQKNKEFSKMQNNLLSLKYKYKTNETEFISISSYTNQKVNRHDYVNILGGLTLDYDIDIEEFSQEFRTNYYLNNSKLLFGAFYSDKLNFNYNEDQSLEALKLKSPNHLNNIDTNKALFTQVDFWNNEDFIYSAGLRYQETKRHFTRDLTTFTGNTTTTDDSTTWKHILPLASISYYTENNNQIYLTYSKGYRPGGYNYRADSTFKPEQTNSIELGFKQGSEKSFKSNSTIFYNKIKNHRINTFDDNLSSIVLNAPKAYSYGAELDAKYKKEKLSLYASLGLIKAKFEEFTSNNIVYKSNNVIDVPNITASLAIKYTLKGNYYIQGDIKHMGKRYYNVSNNAKEDRYTVSNLTLGYKNKKWDSLFYINNIFDERYVDFMISTPSNSYYHFGKPRTIGIKLTRKF